MAVKVQFSNLHEKSSAAEKRIVVFVRAQDVGDFLTTANPRLLRGWIVLQSTSLE